MENPFRELLEGGRFRNTLKNTVSCDVALCSLVSMLRHFGGNVCILLQSARRWRQRFLSELGKFLTDDTSKRTKGQ